MFKKYIGIKSVLLYVCLILSACVFNACKDDEEGSNGTTQLLSFGPSPVLRGGEIKFIGNRLDKVTAIALPGNVEVTTFKIKTPELIIIDVPEETISGEVVLRTPDGNFATKTELEISEPIEITSFSPAKARPGDILTISGEYLNLIEEVYFAKDVKVTDFESHSKTKIEVKIPANAQTGPLIFSNGEEEPILIETKSPMDITLPVVSQISPNPVKAGQQVTITGTDLDLTNRIVFGGEKSVNAFVSKTATTIEVIVPADAQNGKIKLVAASNAGLESNSELALVMPTISSVAPSPAKTGGTITVTGTNLDLINKVVFGSDKAGTIQVGGTTTQITVNVPADATKGIVNFWTAANKSVASPQELTFVKPEITSFSPGSIKTLFDLTIDGTNLDIVKTVKFEGGTSVEVTGATSTRIIVKVPSKTISGKITLIAKNGDEVKSTSDLTVLPSAVPDVSTLPSFAKPGQMITITGTQLNLFTDVIFADNINATMFGTKTATTLEVVVPANVKIGVSKISFKTSDGETSESPEIGIYNPLSYLLYNEDLVNGWQEWTNGAGKPDLLNTEKTFDGSSKAIKYVSSGWSSWGGGFWPSGAPASNYTEFALSIYGGPGTDGKKIRLLVNPTDWANFTTINIVEGKWTRVVIPLSGVKAGNGTINPATWSDIRFQSEDITGNIWFDYIGFR